MTPPRFPTETLHRDEHLLWVGQSIPRLIAFPNLKWVPFSLVWGGFAIVWNALAWLSGLWILRLWGLPFLLMALYALAGRVVYAWVLQQRTWYALTDQRLLIMIDVWPQTLVTLALPDLPPVTTTTTRAGRGNVMVGSKPQIDQWGSGRDGVSFVSYYRGDVNGHVILYNA